MKDTFERISYLYKHYKFLMIVPVAFVLIPIFNKNFENKYLKSFEETVFNYYKSSFSGIIVKKFIDKENHSSRKIVLRNGKIEKVIYLDFQRDALFNRFQVNDTLTKLANQCEISLKRNGNKMSLKFNFENHVDREKYHKNLDSIIFKYLNRLK